MSKLELKIRRIETGEVLHAEFDDEAAAKQWLTERPPFVEVLRVVSQIDPAVEADLRKAMRPLDDEEMDRRDALMSERLLEQQREAAEQSAAVAADPNRPMAVRWERERGMWVPDESDDRPISTQVREAVLAWIDERNSWVRDREQHVAAAMLTVWPAEIPEGQGSDRIQPGGQFVTADGLPAAN